MSYATLNKMHSDGNSPEPKTLKRWNGKYKTYGERAGYLSSINPHEKEMYNAIATFFGENEVPPRLTNSKKK